MRLSSVGLRGSWYKFAIALTNAAKPAAELARPAAVGKLFSLTIFRCIELSLATCGAPASSFCRCCRSSRRQAWVRLPLMSWGWPLRVSVSESKDGAQEAVVCVRRSSCERVTERELLVGRLRVGSRLPQYLVKHMLAQWGWFCGIGTNFITAMLTGAKVLARWTSSLEPIVSFVRVLLHWLGVEV